MVGWHGWRIRKDISSRGEDMKLWLPFQWAWCWCWWVHVLVPRWLHCVAGRSGFSPLLTTRRTCNEGRGSQKNVTIILLSGQILTANWWPWMWTVVFLILCLSSGPQEVTQVMIKGPREVLFLVSSSSYLCYAQCVQPRCVPSSFNSYNLHHHLVCLFLFFGLVFFFRNTVAKVALCLVQYTCMHTFKWSTTRVEWWFFLALQFWSSYLRCQDHLFYIADNYPANQVTLYHTVPQDNFWSEENHIPTIVLHLM